MSRKVKEQPQPPEADPQLLSVLERAGQSLGWFLPETPEEVKAWEEAEAQVDTDVRVVAEPISAFRSNENTEESTGIEEQLARAAREGTGEIGAEIEEAMRRDRERAERGKS